MLAGGGATLVEMDVEVENVVGWGGGGGGAVVEVVGTGAAWDGGTDDGGCVLELVLSTWSYWSGTWAGVGEG